MNDRPTDEVNGILNADRYRESSQQILEQHTSLKALQVDRKINYRVALIIEISF